MLYHTTWLITKIDLIKYLFKASTLFRRIVRWQVLLSEYDILYVSQKAIKGSVITKFLASEALNDYQPLDFDFPDEYLMNISIEEEGGQAEKVEWKMYFDGASNAVGYGIGAILISP